MHRLRVILVDDHPIVRAGLRHFLEQAPDIECVGEATSGEEALAQVAKTSPDVLILDMEMPGLTGVEVARQLQARGSHVRVLALSAYDDVEYINGVLEAGAAGYLLKDEAPASILEAVRGVGYGQTGWVSALVAGRLMRPCQGPAGAPGRGLTPRQLDVLRMVAKGKTNKEVARALGLSETTVEKHLAAAFSTLDATTRAEAVARAMRLGLLQ